MQLQENKDFLTTQIITYLGNKRSLLSHIEHEVELISQKLKKEKLVCADLFSGSGIVARMLKSHAEKLIVNDLENYSAMINSCYLSNKSDYPKKECEKILKCKNDLIGKFGTVKFFGYTNDGKLRFPVLKSIRDYE